MDTRPLVTIAIPTYNRARSYFPQALQSALAQSYSNLDILVSDNGSTDGTRELLDGVSDPRLRYVRHDPGIGQRNNYTFCFEHAKGTYTLLLHDDDTIDSDFVSACIEKAANISDIGLVRTGVRLIDAQGNIIGRMRNEASGLAIDALFQAWFSGKTPVYCCNTLFETEKLLQIGGFNSSHYIYPDTMAVFRLAAAHRRIDIAEVKASYRIHGGEVGFSRNIAEWCEESLDLLHLMCALAPHARAEIRDAGMRFFARANYRRSLAAESPWRRAAAIMKVIKYFGHHHLPSLKTVLLVFRGTRLYNALRLIKRGIGYAASQSV